MRDSRDIKAERDLSNAFIAGERIFGIKFRHNSNVRFVCEDGAHVEGAIVGVGPIEPEPVYTIERSDGRGDEEVPESKIELLFDPALTKCLDRKLRVLYPDASKRREALTELLRYGASADEPEQERVRLAILKLAGGNFEELKQTVEGAKEDPEDIVSWAERPRETRFRIGNQKLRDSERLKIQQADRDEWDSWLGLRRSVPKLEAQ